jgi:hypothetical protein
MAPHVVPRAANRESDVGSMVKMCGYTLGPLVIKLQA